MFLYSKVRYLDGIDNELKDRFLYLETDEHPVELRSAIELAYHDQEIGGVGNSFVQYREYLTEIGAEELGELMNGQKSCRSIRFSAYYFEDESFSTHPAERCWIPVRHGPVGFYDSEQTALQEAKTSIAWVIKDSLE